VGLGITVGLLSDLLQEDPEGAEMVLDDLHWVNAALAENGLPYHDEPRDCVVWSGEGYGYRGLHALREVAALVWLGKGIPRDVLLTGEQKDAGTAHFDACLPSLEAPAKPGFIAGLFGRKSVVPEVLPFLHLSVHSDAQGHYVPQDFAVPVMPKAMNEAAAHLWPVGSAIRLEAEVEALAEILQMPTMMTCEDKALAAALDEPADGDDVPLWQVQPVAAHSCALLRDACRQSRATGAAIIFS
jgi:hypothetical protein